MRIIIMCPFEEHITKAFSSRHAIYIATHIDLNRIRAFNLTCMSSNENINERTSIKTLFYKVALSIMKPVAFLSSGLQMQLSSHDN
jgi:hypothetical protein